MKAINVLLAILVSLVIGVLVLEGGLRLLGKGPVVTEMQFDPELGWSKKPGYTRHKKTPEFDVHYEMNELGLRDDPMSDPSKPAGVYRVLMLGDSFTLGWAVERHNLFVDQLERWWQAENRRVDVINAGTAGYSTDQSVAWLEQHGAEFEPDLVLLFPYENDVYWNGQTDYLGKQKPRFGTDGQLEERALVDTADHGWKSRFALTKGFVPKPDVAKHYFQPGERPIEKEHAVVLLERPDFMKEAEAHTLGTFKAFKRITDELGARAVVAPIPSHSVVDGEAAAAYGQRIGLAPDQWDPDRPVDTLITLAKRAGLETLDARTTLKAAARGDQELYNRVDWHFNVAGNETFASFLHDRLDSLGVFPDTHRAPAGRSVAMPPAPRGIDGPPFWLKLYGVLWLLLTILYYGHYRDEPKWQPPLKVAAMLAAVFAIFMGVKWLVGMLPPSYGPTVMLVFVLGVLGFVLYKVGRRVGTIAELMKSFVMRGHWYLMPLVVVLLTIGSLLVVAASSPLVAPFIYTLF